MIEIVLSFDDITVVEDYRKGRKESFGIWLQDGQSSYPCEGWHDNGLIVLSWWTTSWQSLMNAQLDQGISFMEGPYHLSVVQETGGIVKLVDYNRDTIFETNLDEFGKQLRKALNTVIRYFRNLKIQTENLATAVKCLNIIDSLLRQARSSL